MPSNRYYGSWERSGGNGMRLVMEVSYSNPGHAASSVKFTVKFFTENQWRYNDYQYLNFTGALSGQDQYNNTSGTNSWGGGLIHRATKTWTYTYGSSEYGSSPRNVTFGARVSGAYNGVTPSVSRTIKVPARPYDDPAEPSNVELTRPLVDRLRLDWTRHATSGEPYTSQEIAWRTFTGSSWSGWSRAANVTRSATSYVRDAGVETNAIFQMRIRSVNSVGRSDWAYSGVQATPPAAPERVRARLTSTGATVALSWDSAAYDPPSSLGDVRYEVQRRPGSAGTYATVATDVTGTSWSDTSPEPGDNQYQVRAVASIGNGTNSEWTESSVVSTIVPPLAPSSLSPDGNAVDLETDTVLSWTHRDGGDGADQSHFSIEYSDDGGGTWTALATEVESTESSYVLPAGTLANSTTDYQWRVATQGVTTEAYGPWATASLVGHATPEVTIVEPEFEANSLPLSTSWTYAQAQGDAAVSFTVRMWEEDGTTLLEEDELPGSAGSHVFETFVEDSETYVVEVIALSSRGQLSISSRQATTIRLPVPRTLDIITEYDPLDGSLVLHATIEPGGEPAPATIVNLATNPSVEVDDTGWTTGLASNSKIRDTSRAYSGSASMKATWVEAGATGGFLGLTVAGLTVGQEYTAGAWVLVPEGSAPVDLTAYFVSRANAPTTTTGQWVWLTHTFTATAASERVGITNAGPTTTGQQAWIDSIIIVEGFALTEYFDGDTKSLPTRQFSWTGTPHGSISLSEARGEVDPTSATIERRVAGGRWVTLARELPLPVDFVDPLPSTTGQTEYRVTSVSETPSYRVNDIVVVGGPDGKPGSGWWGYLSYGPGFSRTVRVHGNLSLSASGGREREARRFLGRRSPLPLLGESRNRGLSVGGTLAYEGRIEQVDSRPEEWEQAGIDAGVVCWRDATGRRMFGLLEGDISTGATGRGLASLQFSVVEVDFTETYGG